MKYLEKIVAITTIASLLIASSITTNASINGTTATSTNWVVGTTITITDSGNGFTDLNEITSAVITNLDGSPAWTTTLTVVWDNSNIATSEVVIATADLTDNTSYFIQFTTDNGDFGTTTLRVWTPTNDSLTVTATVEPVLKFGMESNNGSFWVLSTTATWITTWIEIWTNAINWITVSAKTVNGWLSSATASHVINWSLNDALYDDEEYQFSTTLGASDSSSGAVITWATTTSMNTANQSITIYTAAKPQNFDTTGDYDVDFTVSAKIAESTPSASDYTDVIIFTATANF